MRAGDVIVNALRLGLYAGVPAWQVHNAVQIKAAPDSTQKTPATRPVVGLFQPVRVQLQPVKQSDAAQSAAAFKAYDEIPVDEEVAKVFGLPTKPY